MTLSDDDRRFGEAIAASFGRHMDSFRAENDRGVVIVAAAVLDDALTSMLRVRLLPSASPRDELLDGRYAPLSSFEAKIDVAYRVGLIKADVRATLHLLRKLRNDFAHASSHLSFVDEGVRSRVRELLRLNTDLLEMLLEHLRAARTDLGHPATPPGMALGSIEECVASLSWRHTFAFVVAGLAAMLGVLVERFDAIRPIYEVTSG